MRIRRLGWAGIELEADGQTALIDVLQDVTPLAAFVGEPRDSLPPPTPEASVALVTHLHSDHCDPSAIAAALAPDGVLLRPAPSTADDFIEDAALIPAEKGLAAVDVASRIVEPWQTLAVGPFEITALPAADGLGDPQISWIVAADGQRVAHFGDTLFHGWWWRFALRYGPFDVVFLPVNGAVVNFPHRQPPSPLPADLDPRQAAVAAAALGAREAVPIHHTTLHHPPIYAEVDAPVGTFVAEAAERGVATRVLEPGEGFELSVKEGRSAA
jgi:L-ascorbate metabolism protein UlaG (beta-lactamase superfamily)